jgi:hypothetical protein
MSEAIMHVLGAIGYWVWGLGVLVLGGMLAWAYIGYRIGSSGRSLGEADWASRQNAAAQIKKWPNDRGPANSRNAEPLMIAVLGVVFAATALAVGIMWLNMQSHRSPTFDGERASIAHRK